MRTTTKPTFHCSYCGETDYIIDGKRYEVRWRFEDTMPYKDDYKPYVKACVGTVGCASGVDTFPPDYVLAMFPGYVGRRYNEAMDGPEYKDGVAPSVVTNGKGHVMALVYVQDMAAHNIDQDGEWIVSPAVFWANRSV